MKKCIGARVKQARMLKKLTQEQLAEKCNVSLASISRLETGTTMPSIHLLYAIACQLDVGLDFLLADFIPATDINSDPTVKKILALLNNINPKERAFLLSCIELYLNCFHE